VKVSNYMRLIQGMQLLIRNCLKTMLNSLELSF